jgi:hypothetical protein
LDKLQKNKTIGMKNIMLKFSWFSTQSAMATPNKRLDPYARLILRITPNTNEKPRAIKE